MNFYIVTMQSGHGSEFTCFVDGLSASHAASFAEAETQSRAIKTVQTTLEARSEGHAVTNYDLRII